MTSSAVGRKGITNAAHYVATKHAVVGLMRTMANELAQYDIRVNTVHPTAVDTLLIHNDLTYRLFLPDVANPTRKDAERPFLSHNPRASRGSSPRTSAMQLPGWCRTARGLSPALRSRSTLDSTTGCSSSGQHRQTGIVY